MVVTSVPGGRDDPATTMPGSVEAPPGLPVIVQANCCRGSVVSPRINTVSPVAYWFSSCGSGFVQVVRVVQIDVTAALARCSGMTLRASEAIRSATPEI